MNVEKEAERRRGLELPSSSSSMAAALGFRELGGNGGSVGFQGGTEGPRHLYRAERRCLGVRATTHGVENGPRLDSADSTPNTGKKKALTVGACMAEKEGGGRVGHELGREGGTGLTVGLLGRGERRKKGEGERRDGPAGLKRGWGKRKAFSFLKEFKHIQFKFEFKNSNSN